MKTILRSQTRLAIMETMKPELETAVATLTKTDDIMMSWTWRNDLAFCFFKRCTNLLNILESCRFQDAEDVGVRA